MHAQGSGGGANDFARAGRAHRTLGASEARQTHLLQQSRSRSPERTRHPDNPESELTSSQSMSHAHDARAWIVALGDGASPTRSGSRATPVPGAVRPPSLRTWVCTEVDG